MFLCRLGARRQIHLTLNTPRVASYLSVLADERLHRVPHGDTVGDALSRLLPEELGDLRTDLVRSMIQRRRLEGFRLLGHDYLVTLDASGFLALGHEASAFTEGCLTRSLDGGQTLYYRPVLEAKLVTRTGLALSVETEFVENVPRKGQGEEAYKQDCELKGAARLLPRLKEAFPNLSICVLLDALYAGEPTFALCEQLGWRFITVLKEGSIPTLYREFYDLVDQAPENRRAHSTRRGDQVLRWVNDIDCNGRTLSVLECVETPRGSTKPTRWLWVTNIPITRDNCIQVANQGGRQRWRTENEGFNVQKNGGYAMEHAYAKTPQAAKNFYLLLQIAHTIAQLFECRMGGKTRVTRDYGSLRNFARSILHALLYADLPSADKLNTFLNTPIQVRLDTS